MSSPSDDIWTAEMEKNKTIIRGSSPGPLQAWHVSEKFEWLCWVRDTLHVFSLHLRPHLRELPSMASSSVSAGELFCLRQRLLLPATLLYPPPSPRALRRLSLIFAGEPHRHLELDRGMISVSFSSPLRLMPSLELDRGIRRSIDLACMLRGLISMPNSDRGS